jgi:hypothetical protein
VGGGEKIVTWMKGKTEIECNEDETRLKKSRQKGIYVGQIEGSVMETYIDENPKR